MALPHGGGDSAVQGFDHGRALLGGVCEVVVAVSAVVVAVVTVIVLVVEITKENEPPVIQNVQVTINQSGNGQITIPIDADYINDDGTDICDTCGLDVEAGECLENCTGYDKDATNDGLETNILEV